MQIEDWNQRWENDQIGFHEQQPNAYLTRHIHTFNLAKGASVFVPLCGKSQDLLWLASQGYQVIGIECSKKAVIAFFQENKLDYQVQQHGEITAYYNQQICLYQGDFFALNQSLLTSCDFIYDRASLIAIANPKRKQYIEHLRQWFSEQTQMLLITLSYDQEKASGPPFSASKDEIEHAFHDKNIITLESNDVIDEGPKWRRAGLESVIETAFRVTKK